MVRTLEVDITRLVSNFTDKIKINTMINFKEQELVNTEIRALKDLLVTGYLSKSSEHIYNLNINVTGSMVLPCTLTSEDIIYPLSLSINEILSDIDESSEKYLKINGNMVDIKPIIWQNIVLVVPNKVESTVYKAESIKVNNMSDK